MRIEPGMKSSLQSIADSHGMTLSVLVRRVLKHWLVRQEQSGQDSEQVLSFDVDTPVLGIERRGLPKQEQSHAYTQLIRGEE